jgi:type II secretory pathway pseudopilin PulG
MKRLIAVALITTSSLVLAPLLLAQTRGAELDKAVEEARAAYIALQEAEKRRDAGLEPQSGERIGTAAGGATRPTEQYLGRQMQLEHEVEQARRRYEAAQKRWNDLK